MLKYLIHLCIISKSQVSITVHNFKIIYYTLIYIKNATIDTGYAIHTELTVLQSPYLFYSYVCYIENTCHQVNGSLTAIWA